MTVVFLGLSCDMILVVASIGSYGLLGTEALQSCLPHQLDLRTGQLWVEGQSTLQLHQQRQAPRADAHLTTSVVLPPDSEVVAPVSVWTASSIRPGPCSLMEPCMTLTEDYGVLVGRTLVDTSSWSASVLMVNPSLEVVIPSFSCMGYLVSVSAVSVARAESVGGGGGWGPTGPPGGHCYGIPPLLGEVGRLMLTSICSCFPGPRGTRDGTYHLGSARDPDFGCSAGPVRASPAGPGRSPDRTDVH